MRLGLWGARADAGGLAAMTYEFARHLQPDRTMIIDLEGRGRGPAHPERYRWGDVRVNKGMNDAIAKDTVRSFLDGLDVVYLAETSYYEPFCDLARAAGVLAVLHAMPELWRAGDAQPDQVWVPTEWEAERIPGCRVVPVPVPTDIFAPEANRQLARVRRGNMLHVAAPAFHDRNGTDLVTAAMGEVTRPVRITFAGGTHHPPRVANYRGGRVDLAWRPGGSVDRRDVYPDDCGALILPRRYAGLSLPMQEAAGLGWPIVSLDLEPQRRWLHPDLLVPAQVSHEVRMVGGTFPVHTADPISLARVIDRLVDDPELADEAAKMSIEHAHALSWERWAPIYRELLEEL